LASSAWIRLLSPAAFEEEEVDESSLGVVVPLVVVILRLLDIKKIKPDSKFGCE